MYFVNYPSVDGGPASFGTFKHGAFHGALLGVLLAMPLIAQKAIFERLNFKYVAINAGYWIVALAVMGAIIAAMTAR